jgi:sRNA-binding carbon storage regulator CsrA
MLTISRKSGESVVIQVAGQAPLTITFLGSRPGKCQLAFDGPLDYHILREELQQRDALPASPPSWTSDNRSRLDPGRGSLRIPIGS